MKKKKYPALAFRPGKELNARVLAALPKLNLTLSEFLRQSVEAMLVKHKL